MAQAVKCVLVRANVPRARQITSSILSTTTNPSYALYYFFCSLPPCWCNLTLPKVKHAFDLMRLCGFGEGVEGGTSAVWHVAATKFDVNLG